MENDRFASGDKVSFSSLEAATATLVREVEEGGRGKLITRDGVPVAVLLGAGEYERLQQEASLSRLVAELRQAETELAAGAGIGQEEIEQELETRWGR